MAEMYGHKEADSGHRIKALIKDRKVEHHTAVAAKAKAVMSQKAEIFKAVQKQITELIMKHDDG
jgi:hypothetical protein